MYLVVAVEVILRLVKKGSLLRFNVAVDRHSQASMVRRLVAALPRWEKCGLHDESCMFLDPVENVRRNLFLGHER